MAGTWWASGTSVNTLQGSGTQDVWLAGVKHLQIICYGIDGTGYPNTGTEALTEQYNGSSLDRSQRSL